MLAEFRTVAEAGHGWYLQLRREEELRGAVSGVQHKRQSGLHPLQGLLLLHPHMIPAEMATSAFKIAFRACLRIASFNSGRKPLQAQAYLQEGRCHQSEGNGPEVSSVQDWRSPWDLKEDHCSTCKHAC